jgi:hypothetical protein
MSTVRFWFRGFAAFRAGSFRLSVKPTTLFGGSAARGEASPSKEAHGKPEAFRTGRGKAANPNPSSGLQALLHFAPEFLQ